MLSCLSVVLMITVTSTQRSAACLCPQPAPQHAVQLIDSRYTALQCCDAEHSMNITWLYHGSPGSATQGKVVSRRNQLTLLMPLPRDAGLYRCYSGAQQPCLVKTINVTIVSTEPRVPQLSCSGGPSHTVWALPGQPAVLQCRATLTSFTVALESTSSFCFTWFSLADDGAKILRDGEMNVSVATHCHIRSGTANTSLSFSSVHERQFGVYVCRTFIIGGDDSHCNVTLRKGVSPEHQDVILHQHLTVSLVVALLLTGVTVVFLYRNRYIIALMLRTYSTATERHKQDPLLSSIIDVFVISGPASEGWVHTVLLPLLERRWGYTCYYPPRDLLPGEAGHEVVSDVLLSSRAVLTVLTGSLGDEGWARHCLDLSVGGRHSRGRSTLCVVMEDLKMLDSLHSEYISTRVKLMRKISYPIMNRSASLHVEESGRNKPYRSNHTVCSKTGADGRETAPPRFANILVPHRVDGGKVLLVLAVLRSLCTRDIQQHFWHQVLLALPPPRVRLISETQQ